MCTAVSRQLVRAGFGGLAQLAPSVSVLDHVVRVFTSSAPPNSQSHAEPATRLSCE